MGRREGELYPEASPLKGFAHDLNRTGFVPHFSV